MPCVKEFEFFFFVTNEYITLKWKGKEKETRRNLSMLAVNDNGKTEECKFVNIYIYIYNFLENVSCRFV